MSSSDSSRPWAGQLPPPAPVASPQRANSTTSPSNNAGAPLRPARSLLRRTGVKSPIGSQTSGRSQSASIKAADSGMARLLVTTRQLLDCLTLWSQGSASEKDVSDVYVKLGNEFNVVCRSFQHLGMDVTDLGDVPGSLRGVLEPALALPASAATLERFLPRIRQIFFVLLQGLKSKQNLLRTLQTTLASTDTPPPSQPGHHHSSDAIPQRRPSQAKRTVSARSASSTASADDPNVTRSNAGSAQGRRSAASTPADFSSTQSSYFNLETTAAINSRPQPESSSGGDQRRPGSSASLQPSSDGRKGKSHVGPDIPLPPTPPGYIPSKSNKSLDALSALQKSEALERRASRRFSAYQMAKMNNAPYISPDHSAAAQRNSTLRSAGIEDETQKQRFLSGGSKSPSYLARASAHITTPPPQNGRSSLRRTNIPSSPLQESQTSSSPIVGSQHEEQQQQPVESHGTPPKSSDVPKDSIVLFVQLGHQVKRVQISPQGLNMNKLRLIFVEKFSYSPGTDSFPEIYRQDPHTSIRYELDDQEIGHLADSDLLSLNVDPQDEIKKFLLEGIQPISSAVAEIKKSMDDQNINMKKLASDQEGVNSRLESRIEELSKIRISEPGHAKSESADDAVNQDDERRKKIYEDQINVVSKLRKDIAVMRQVHQDSVKFFTDIINNLTKEAIELKNAPPPPGSASRSYISKSYSKLNQDSDGLLAMVDGLQDTVEGLRQDIARRGVRPTPRQLENIMEEMRSARKELGSMTHYIKTEKPVWKKIWEKELDTVCEEQQFFTLQEDLVTDLGEDLDRVSETISLVEQCLGQQQKNPPRQVVVGGSSFLQAKGSGSSALSTSSLQEAVLNDLKSLTPDHDSRVEAIEKAEKLRKKELDTRLDEFERELGQFVGEGRLRKSGGVEETERLRRQREEDVWKSTFGSAPGVLEDSGSDSASSNDSDSDSDKGEDNSSPPVSAPSAPNPATIIEYEEGQVPEAGHEGPQLQASAINEDKVNEEITLASNETPHLSTNDGTEIGEESDIRDRNEAARPETPQKVHRKPVLDIDVTSGPTSPSTPHTPGGSQSSRSIPATPRSSSMLLE